MNSLMYWRKMSNTYFMQIDYQTHCKLHKSFNFFDRSEEKGCMKKQEEEKVLSFHLEGFQSSNLISSVA